MNAYEIRNSFLDFFRSKGHEIVPSAPIVVKNDPTLMFTNAGMNQFKDIFLGNQPQKWNRAADTQKCLRVSGKHNDLEEVGHDTYHHTMFEMLCNWSFGDYFKKEAIAYAWEYLTEVVKIDKDKLYVTVFGGDEKDGQPADMEAFGYWKEHVSEDRIIYGNKKDNFWEMGETGPCGPCSEIHIDLRDDAARKQIAGRDLVNKDDPQVIEIWNLVFMQYNRMADGHLVELPAKHVDTGMGFERLVRVLQGKTSNYDTDVFQPLIQEIAKMSGIEYGKAEKTDVAMRVIADHCRAVSFAIADGQLPSNNGAGYVIRRVLRRAVRYGFTFLGFEEPFVCNLLPILVQQMEHNFPEIKAQQELVGKVIREEEAAFLRTLAQGIKRFEGYVEQHKNQDIDGNFAFELFDTFGFPIDLTQLMAAEKGINVDMDGFKANLEEQKNRSRKAAEKANGDWVVVNESEQPTEFVGYTERTCESHILRFREVVAKKQKHFEIVLDRTPFYAEMGGEVGDTGTLTSENETIHIINTVKENNLVIHITEQLPQNPEATFTAAIDSERRQRIANNHSATHLMHSALKQVLGSHVEQKGSLVDDQRLRFDFSHFAKMTDEEIRQVEKIVNQKIRENIPNVTYAELPIEEAKAMGATALFGEKYGDTVRVVVFDKDYSMELCGGCHTSATGNIGIFKIVSEGAIAAGIRRIEAITGEAVEQYLDEQLDLIGRLKEIVKSPDLVKGVTSLSEQNSALKKEVEHLMQEKAQDMAKTLLANATEQDGCKFISDTLCCPGDQLRNIALLLKQMDESVIAILGSVTEGKPSLCLLLPEALANAKDLDATKLIREVAKEIQGGGGGQKTLCVAGGRNADGLQKAMEMLREKI
ncbi:MAG: alanine--tRNA ligase [Bacteroidales bacterium]|nr:alanine--tRNA ligase [Bacteroidales bacterium]